MRIDSAVTIRLGLALALQGSARRQVFADVRRLAASRHLVNLPAALPLGNHQTK